jgi:predicted Zn-dependent protease
MTSRYTGTDDDPAVYFEREAGVLFDLAPAALGPFSDGSSHADLFLEHAHRTLDIRRARPGAAAESVRQATATTGTALNVVRGSEAFYGWFDRLTSTSVRDVVQAARTMLAAAGPETPEWAVPRSTEQQSVTEASMTDEAAEAILHDVSDCFLGVEGLDGWTIALERSVRRRLVISVNGRAAIDCAVDVRLVADVRAMIAGRPVRLRHIAELDAEGTDRDRASAAFVDDVFVRLDHARDARLIDPLVTTVVMAAGWSGTWIHEAVGHMLEADVFFDGPFADKLGERVAPSDVTIVDGANDGALDDEGVVVSATTLLGAGRIESLLADQRTARRFGVPPTGNGFRTSVRHAPLPRMSKTSLKPVEGSGADLVADVQEGVLVTGFRDAQTSRSGEIIIHGVEGFRIENGSLAHPVRDCRLEGHAAAWLANIVRIGADSKVESARGRCVKHGQAHRVVVDAPSVTMSGIRVSQH